MLEVINLKGGYGESEVLHDISIKADDGQFIAVIGPNGAGKSTLQKTISGLLKPISGKIIFDGKEINGLDVGQILKLGILYVPQGSEVFFDMTIEENLEMGGYALHDRTQLRRNMEKAYDFFPFLKERRNAKAGYLSGGERAMLAIGRGLVGNPQLLLLDEPTIGLDIGKQGILIDKLKELKKEKLNFLLVEQNLKSVSQVCDKVYVMSSGRIKYEGDTAILGDPEKISSMFFGSSRS
ncbi:MAG: ABC transporter ATP-binding protein [Thaumarchaeota archaeon]|jgi:ABC-type branched-subunit amino acid transport system ATPase component|nr:ABC transporter ATP-binding protein [Nitrososphaerota archaeon]MDG7041176.1 ABC transporter ATP-binding protein [Nitrososphaerota archaeon]MDG7043632.1 ABC transporter ATP-binding protein [Nitrososphaerota archaeon]